MWQTISLLIDAINRRTEGQGDLLTDTRTSPHRITLLHVDNRTNDILVRTFWPGLRAPLEPKTAKRRGHPRANLKHVPRR
jgi:hypothetical protein